MSIRSNLLKGGCIGLFILAASSQLAAQDRNEVITFAQGSTSKSVSGSIKGYDGINYRLNAAAGQTMSVLFSPDNTSCYFNLVAPGSPAALFNGSINGNEFAGELPSSGDYSVQVYMMRNAARRNETCNYEVTFEISGERQPLEKGDLEDIKLDDEAEDNPVHFTRRDARGACQRRVSEQYGVRRSAFSEVGVRNAGRDHYWVKGKVVRHRGQPDIFTCRVVHGEVMALRVHPETREAEAVGKSVLGGVLPGVAVAHAKSDFQNDPHPPYANGNPLRDRGHLNRACRHEIARNLRHSHADFETVRIVTGHLRNRALSGEGSIRWYNTDHLVHFTCHFDRRGRVVDGQFYYYPDHSTVSIPASSIGNDGSGNWRVVDVASNDVLFVHSRASLASPRIGSLPFNARNVRNYGCRWSDIDKGTWCEIDYRGLRGFAAKRYLAGDG